MKNACTKIEATNVGVPTRITCIFTTHSSFATFCPLAARLLSYQRWGPYLQTGLWGFNMGKILVSCGQYLDRTLGKFLKKYGPHLLVYYKEGVQFFEWAITQ